MSIGRERLLTGLIIGAVALLTATSCVRTTTNAQSALLTKTSPGANLVYVSWGDQIMVAKGDAQLDTPEKIERCVAGWAEHFDAGTILWRGSFLYIKEFYERRHNPGFVSQYYAKVDSVSAQFQPLDVVRRETRKHGQKMMIYMTVFDHGAPTNRLYGGNSPFPWQDRETIAHPEWQTVDLKGVPHYGVLDFSWPEARRLMVNRIKNYVERFDCDGVYVCTRTHSLPALHADQFGFGPKIVAEFKRRIGVDILSDQRFDYTSPKYAPDDPLLDQWRKLRGEYLVQFYRELRSALPDKNIITGIPRGRYLGPPYGNLYLDWEKIVGEKLVDGLVLGVVSGAGLHPPLRVSHRTIGYLSSEDDQIAIPSQHECVKSVYGLLCHENGVNLYLRSGYSMGFARWVKDDPNLTGAMIGCPSSAPSPGLPHDDALNFAGGEMTVEAFLKLDPHRRKEWQRVLSKYNHEGDNQARGWEWIILPDGRFRFRINLCDPNMPESGQDIALDTKEALPLDQWTHVATVYDRPERELRLYINGKLVVQRSIPDKPLRVNSDQDLVIGCYGGSAISFAEGVLDELRISTVARNFSELPRAPYMGTEPGTLALYHFDMMIDGTTCANSVPHSVLRSVLTGIDGSKVEEGPSGFGCALRMGE